MNRKIAAIILVALGAMAALGGGSFAVDTAYAVAIAGDDEPAVPQAVQAGPGTAFTYQGRLTNSGTGAAIAGSCDFRFYLYEDGLGGSQVAGPVDRADIALSDGYFATSVDFGASAFTGEGRQMQVRVKCAGDADYVTLSGMVPLSAAPYAHSLRPGAQIASDTAGEFGAVVRVEDSYSGNFASSALGGESDQGVGVAGVSATGTGVSGEATSGSGTNYGVYGSTASPSGHGVYGTSPSTNPVYAGVTGVNTGGGAGAGVYGYSVGGYGVHARSTGNKALYADGDAHVAGTLSWDTWQTYTSAVAVPVSAFIPERYASSADVPYYNDGYYLKNESGRDNEWYTAPVHLPHGATITKMGVAWADGSDKSGTLSLRRRSMTDVIAAFDTLASVTSEGSATTLKQGVWDDDTIDYATVDNAAYTYYLEVALPNQAEYVRLLGVTIFYEMDRPY